MKLICEWWFYDTYMQIKGQKFISSWSTFWAKCSQQKRVSLSLFLFFFWLNRISLHSTLPMWARQCFYQSLWGSTEFRGRQSSMRTFLDMELLVLPTCLYPGTALYLKLCLWSKDQPLEHTTHPLLCYIAKDQPEWYVLCNQTPRRQEQLFLTVALSFSEPSFMPIL